MEQDKILWSGKPSPRVIFSWLFGSAWAVIMFFVFMIVVLFIIGLIFKSKTSALDALMRPMLYVAIFFFAMFIYRIIELPTFHYKITANGIHLVGGLLKKKQKYVPYKKITNVEVSQNLIEQILHISKLNFQTAGTGGQPIPEIVFEGLVNVETPKNIVYEHITKK